MKIKVYDAQGSKGTYEADSFADHGDGNLNVSKGDDVVALYARGQWINAEVVAEDS